MSEAKLDSLQQQQQPQQLVVSSASSSSAASWRARDSQTAILSYPQVRRLSELMEQRVPIHGRGNFPMLEINLSQLIRKLSGKFRERQVHIRDIRLNGGGASFVLAPECAHYNDLDLVFGTSLQNEAQFDVIRDAVLDCLRDLHAEACQTNQLANQNNSNSNNTMDQNGTAGSCNQMVVGQQQHQLAAYQQPSDCALKEAYVQKMVKVNDDDRWSLISLGVNQNQVGCNLELNSQQQQQNYSIRNVTNNQNVNINYYQDQQQQLKHNNNIHNTVNNNIRSTHHHHHHNQHQLHHHHQRRRFPNSIELKFVDRMRRKFEFSVDSFQIILDSLIEFYHFAPRQQQLIARQQTHWTSNPGLNQQLTNTTTTRQQKNRSLVNDNDNNNSTTNQTNQNNNNKSTNQCNRDQKEENQNQNPNLNQKKSIKIKSSKQQQQDEEFELEPEQEVTDRKASEEEQLVVANCLSAAAAAAASEVKNLEELKLLTDLERAAAQAKGRTETCTSSFFLFLFASTSASDPTSGCSRVKLATLSNSIGCSPSLAAIDCCN